MHVKSLSNLLNIMNNFSTLLADKISVVLPNPSVKNSGLDLLYSSMRYTTLSEAKHLRPFLAFATSQIFNVDIDRILPVCVAIEFIHVYSLIHDDLPAMDNSDYRRGKLSCHKKFSEAIAILTGDSLLTLAFELLSTLNESSDIRCKIIQTLAKNSGHTGMIGGQILDILKKAQNIQQIKNIHLMKTAKLFSASCMLGGIMGNATNKEISILANYGENIGYAFQIQDDIKDITNDSLENNITNVMNVENAKKYMYDLLLESNNLLTHLTKESSILNIFTNFLKNTL